jgi:hypothetical protein
MGDTARSVVINQGSSFGAVHQRSNMNERTESLISATKSEFNRALCLTGADVILTDKIIDGRLWLTFSQAEISKSLEIPLPVLDEKGLELLKNGDVIRVVCDYWLEREQTRLNFHKIIVRILCDNINAIRPDLDSGGPLIGKIVKSFAKGQVSYMVSSAQRLINDIVNVMPLHETDMNSWAMNHRLIIIDPAFMVIGDPNEKLEYQVQKNEKYYDKLGWTAIGLSDGVLADKNYILTTDLRLLTPFSQYHNPQRNLYSTLGMKGDELPRIRSASMQKLIDQGVSRKGWNLTTAVIDTPLNFEDQILVDKRLLGYSHKFNKRFVVYGDKILVKKGEEVKTGDPLGYSQDGQKVAMSIRCDRANVIQIKKDVELLNGDPIEVWAIVVRIKRFLRDGSKFSNLHGNKGIARFAELGYAVDPRTGELIPIDIMISGTSVKNRKNGGQILEALANNVTPGSDPIVLKDDIVVEKDEISKKLKEVGLPEDGTWMIRTYDGEYHQAIVGKMFWGVTKDPEDQSWDGDRTELTNNRELRVSGLKFSHVEFKALMTRFGAGNPIVDEIMSHAQGVEILQDGLRVLRSTTGELDQMYPVIDAKDINFVDTTDGIFNDLAEIKGTVVDDEFMPEGFTLRLPCYFQAIVQKDDPEHYTWGLPQEVQNPEDKYEYIYNKIFIPNALIRRCWRHPSGKWGLNTVGNHINRIVEASHRYVDSNEISDQLQIINCVARYLRNMSNQLGTKKGELSTYGMSIRYPHSSRATAALSDDLPENTVEIHRERANRLKVKSGDVVLAERFPCLGFMSIVPQYVKVTDDPQCKYVIRVSGNSLVCQNLDHDGDTEFIASFHTPQAIEALRNEMINPNPLCEAVTRRMNAKKVPVWKEMTLNDFKLSRFPKPTNEEHAELVRKATGVKSHTGPVIALAYNLMRIVERNVPYSDVHQHVSLEVLLDFLGNTVFKQKHGIKSLQEEATDAICTGDVEEMVRLGFERQPSQLLCDLIRKEAASIKIRDIVQYHQKVKEKGWPKVINLIVRRKNKIYFATRAQLSPFNLLKHLEEKPVDLPSFMLDLMLKSDREKVQDKIERLKADRMKIRNLLQTKQMTDIYDIISEHVDKMMVKA